MKEADTLKQTLAPDTRCEIQVELVVFPLFQNPRVLQNQNQNQSGGILALLREYYFEEATVLPSSGEIPTENDQKFGKIQPEEL